MRNNVFDGSTSSEYSGAISVEKRGSEIPPTRVNIYHNTIYKTDSSGPQVYGLYVYDAREVEVKNNLVQLPTGITRDLFYCDQCGNVVSGGNLLTDSPLFVDPTNGNYLLRDFSLNFGSPAIDAGDDDPLVFDDFLGNPRGDIDLDAGAFER